MSISATRSAPQDIESLLIFKKRPQIKDSNNLSDLDDSDIVTASVVKPLALDVSNIKIVIPAAPEENGTYSLTCTVSGTDAEYAWTTLS